jgi:hypothetical protein
LQNMRCACAIPSDNTDSWEEQRTTTRGGSEVMEEKVKRRDGRC